MKNFAYLTLALLAGLFIISCGEDEIPDDMNMEPDPVEEIDICATGLYKEIVVDTVVKTTVKYGENISANGSGDLQELYMDIYTSSNDTVENKAVIIWAFGGSFVAGSKEQMEPYCRAFAEKGFVTAAIDYRLLNPLAALTIDSVKALNIAIKAMHDMKASVRHMRKEADNGNPYKIDPDKIYVAGLSAGAITALNVGILDESDTENIESHIQEVLDENDGLEGASGDAENLSYSSKVAGIINLSGGIYRLDWYDATDPPIASIHGTDDATVPYDYDWVVVSTINVMKLYGSGDMHPHLESVGVPNTLQTVDGGGHTNIYTASAFLDSRDEFFDNMIYNLFEEDLCN